MNCRLGVDVDLNHPLDNLIVSIEADSSLSNSLLFAELYDMHLQSSLDLINDCKLSLGLFGLLSNQLNSHFV